MMTASEQLAAVYERERYQFIGFDGEFWRHEPNGDWIWVVDFKSTPVRPEWVVVVTE